MPTAAVAGWLEDRARLNGAWRAPLEAPGFVGLQPKRQNVAFTRTLPNSPDDHQRAAAASQYPWFDLYDEQLGDLAGSEILKGVKSVKEMDRDKGFDSQQDDEPVDMEHVMTYDVPEGNSARGRTW